MFGVGSLSAILSMLANKTQHEYYGNVRDRKNDLEDRLKLGELRLATTVGMGAVRTRLARVTTLQQFILLALLAADLIGAGAGVSRASRSGPTARVELAARVVLQSVKSPPSAPIVFSRRGHIDASATPRPDEAVLLRLDPGRYEVFALTGQVCWRTVLVTKTPLQDLAIHCP